MTTDTEALRARFEKLLSDSGRACLYEGDGQYGYPHDFSWLCYQAGYAAACAVPADVGWPAAWIQHHKAGDNLEWDDPGGKRTPLYTADQLAAGVARERERAFTLVDGLANGMTATGMVAASIVTKAVAKSVLRGDAIRAGDAKEVTP